MNQIHFYFLIQTYIGQYATYLANTRLHYLPNVLTQINGSEISELAQGFISNIIDLEEGEKLEYIYSSDSTGRSYVLVSVDLASSRRAKIQGCNWVGYDFVLNLITKNNPHEQELIKVKLHSSRSLYEQLRSVN